MEIMGGESSPVRMTLRSVVRDGDPSLRTRGLVVLYIPLNVCQYHPYGKAPRGSYVVPGIPIAVSEVATPANILHH